MTGGRTTRWRDASSGDGVPETCTSPKFGIGEVGLEGLEDLLEENSKSRVERTLEESLLMGLVYQVSK